MFLGIEVEQTHPSLKWMDISIRDTVNEGSVIIRSAVDDPPRMVADFLQRYMAKREHQFQVPETQTRVLEELFEEAEPVLDGADELEVVTDQPEDREAGAPARAAACGPRWEVRDAEPRTKPRPCG